MASGATKYAIGAAPGTPAANYARQYVDSADRLPKQLDDKGIVSVMVPKRLNFLRNSGFWFAQRQTPGTLTSYTTIMGRQPTADGWCQWVENSGMQYRRVDMNSAAETGVTGRYYGEFTKITALGKLGFTQAIEGIETEELRGRNVRIQIKLKTIVAASADYNIALVQLNSSGTIDTIPKGASLFTTAAGANGVDPTLGTNLAYIAPATGKTGDVSTGGTISTQTNAYRATVTSSWQRFGGVFTVPSNCRNLVLFVWSNNQVATTNGVAAAEVELIIGEEVQDAWNPLPIGLELRRCLRFYAKTFDLDTAPAQNAGVNNSLHFMAGKAGAGVEFGEWRFPEPLWTTSGATITYYNPSAANANIRDVTGAVDGGAGTTSQIGNFKVLFTGTGNAATAVGNIMAVNISIDSEL